MKPHPRSIHFLFLIGLVLGVIQVQALKAQDIDVWVDFTSDFHDGSNGASNGVADWIDELNQATNAKVASFTFTSTERATIESNIVDHLTTIYSGYNVNFVTAEPAAGPYDVLYMARDNDHPDVSSSNFGSATVDLGNFNTRQYSTTSGNPPGVPRITTGNFDSFIETSNPKQDQISEISFALAGTAAHEYGHSLGLLHHFTYSDSGISPSNYSGTTDLQNQHVLATGSTGLNEAGRETLRNLSPFSRVMLDITGGAEPGFSSQDNLSLVDSPVISDRTEKGTFDAGDSISGAFDLLFATGESSGNEISFVEADLDGLSTDIDVFGFSVDSASTAVMSAHVFSERLSFGSIEFDPVLELLDSAGSVLFSNDDFFYDDNVLGVGGEKEDDPFLLNILLDSGDYFLRVSPATDDISDSPSVGDRYWLVTSLELTTAVPEPSSCVVLVGIALVASVRRKRSR